LVEHWTENPGVGGSIPPLATNEPGAAGLFCFARRSFLRYGCFLILVCGSVVMISIDSLFGECSVNRC